MRYANITGWGKYVPPVVMSNDDLARVVETSNEWIVSRSGIERRHYSHLTTGEMAWQAAEQALAAAGVAPEAIDMLIVGTTTGSDLCPNTASFVLDKLGAGNAGCMDLNSACTSWFYALCNATAMVRSGQIERALVIGAEHLSIVMNWHERSTAVLFGDGAGAVVIEACDQPSGLLHSAWSVVRDSREVLEMNGLGINPTNLFQAPARHLAFDGQAIFKNAVKGMADACAEVLAKAGLGVEDIDLFVPHQANIRIIEALAKRLDFPLEKIVVRIQEYANTSAASIPLALTDALEAGRVQPGMTILMATFGGGLTCGAGLLKWGERIEAKARAPITAASFNGNVFDLMQESFAYHGIDVSSLLSGE